MKKIIPITLILFFLTIQSLFAATRQKIPLIPTDALINMTAAKTLTVTGNATISETPYTPGGTDVVVADGGTGVSSFTVYAPLYGGTTTTGPIQSGTVGTAGQVLTSNGAGALPTFQAPGAASQTPWTQNIDGGGFNLTNTTGITATTFTGALAGNAATVTNGVYTSRYVNTTAPLTGGGDLSANRTIVIPKGTTSVDGYINATDWATFNSKGNASYEFSANNFNGTGNFTTTGRASAATYGSDGSVTDAELLYINTLSSNAQTQISAKGDMSYANTRFTVITATRDFATATGNVAYTGAGFAPKAVMIFAVGETFTAATWGMSDGTTSSGIADYSVAGTGANLWTSSGGNWVNLQKAAGEGQGATLASLDADGCTLAWTKTGSPTGTAYLRIMFFR